MPHLNDQALQDMNKESYFDLVIESTPEPLQTLTEWATRSKLGMLFIEFRPMDTIKYNLWNIANVYGGGDTALTIVHSGENKELIMETTKDWKNVKYIQAFENNRDVNVYSKLLTSYEFWNTFSEFEYILINQWDSYIFKKIPEEFLNMISLVHQLVTTIFNMMDVSLIYVLLCVNVIDVLPAITHTERIILLNIQTKYLCSMVDSL